MKVEAHTKAVPCKKCKFMPEVTSVSGDLFYARCSNPKCTRWDPYEFLGSTPDRSIKAWNLYNN